MKTIPVNFAQHIENTMIGTNMSGIKHRTFDFEHLCFLDDERKFKVRVVGYFLKFPTYNSYSHFDVFTSDYKMRIPNSTIHYEDIADINHEIYKMMDREGFND